MFHQPSISIGGFLLPKNRQKGTNMGEMSKELQMVYDWCEQKKNALDKNAEMVDDFTVQMMLTNQSTAYWAVQQFILVNFVEDKEN